MGFSKEIAAANEDLFDSSLTDEQLMNVVGEWLTQHQPCLFGRMAAKNGFLRYCILTEADLISGDERIEKKIRDARSAWTRDGYDGKASGFVILAISKNLSYALPDETVKEIALRLCSLYLRSEILADTIYHDQMFLELPVRIRLLGCGKPESIISPLTQMGDGGRITESLAGSDFLSTPLGTW